LIQELDCFSESDKKRCSLFEGYFEAIEAIDALEAIEAIEVTEANAFD